MCTLLLPTGCPHLQKCCHTLNEWIESDTHLFTDQSYAPTGMEFISLTQHERECLPMVFIQWPHWRRGSLWWNSWQCAMYKQIHVWVHDHRYYWNKNLLLLCSEHVRHHLKILLWENNILVNSTLSFVNIKIILLYRHCHQWGWNLVQAKWKYLIYGTFRL